MAGHVMRPSAEEQRAERWLPLYRVAGLACCGASAAVVILLFPRVLGTLAAGTVVLIGWLWVVEQLLSGDGR